MRLMNRSLPVLMLAAVVLVGSGCIYSREIARTKHDIERQLPGAEFERGFTLSVGGFGIRVLQWLSRLLPGEEMREVREYAGQVERVKIGLYRVRELPDSDVRGTPVLHRMVREGWEPALRVRDEKQRVWVFYRERDKRVRDLFVIVLDDENLIIARVKGHLDKVFDRVVREYGTSADLVRLD